jgi:hypothetical protein
MVFIHGEFFVLCKVGTHESSITVIKVFVLGAQQEVAGK